MTLHEFIKQYKYKSDKEKFNTSLDIWEVIEPNEEGIYEGDCESYCRTLKHIDKQFKDWDYYYCKLNGEGHCILLDYENMKMIDNNTKEIIHMGHYLKRYKITDLRKYNWFTIFSKILFAKIFKIIGRIND